MGENNSRPIPTGRTNSGSRRRVRPLHGRNGKAPGGLLKNPESQGRSKQSVENERRDPLLTVLWRNSPKISLKSSICLVADRSFTTVGGLL